MVDSFTFSGTGRLIFGPGKFEEIRSLIIPERALLLCGNSFAATEHYRSIASSFRFIQLVKGEPGPVLVDSIVREVRGKIDTILAVGGGSVLDTGKAVAAMCCSEGSVEDYLEGVGTRKPTGETLPLIAVPTTAGTGSEATKNAVLCRRGSEGYKKSLRHDNYIPSVALIDPELYLSCPDSVMASCGMDAFSQLLESYISTGSNIYTDTLAIKGLEIFLDHFPALISGRSRNSGTMGYIAFSAYLSGICLANAGLGTVHGIAGPLGGFFEIPHGIVCGTLLPEIIDRTVQKGAAQNKLENLDRLIRERELAGSVVELLHKWLNDFRIPRLSRFGITDGDAEKIAAASGNKSHPVSFTTEEIADIIKARL